MIEKEEIRRVITSRQRRSLPPEDKRRAAVLVPLYAEDGTYQILLAKRTEHLQVHQGQIAFPGGTWHPGDANPIATALREAHEEVGIRPEDVDVLGELDDTSTATSNFLITPVVGVIPPSYPFHIEKEEVAELLTLSLEVLRDPQAFQEEMWDRDGRMVRVFVRREGSEIIWGATARILLHLGEILFPTYEGH
jgi:8-oxo-dGTP pyrophosphatase MutT (NUDIX family)